MKLKQLYKLTYSDDVFGHFETILARGSLADANPPIFPQYTPHCTHACIAPTKN